MSMKTVVMPPGMNSIQCLRPRPKDYPLPWCVELNLPFWKINILLCVYEEGWAEWQKSRYMSEVIPKIKEKFNLGD
jgi:hypothetical protein